MRRYLITYDLVGTSETSQDYRRLIERIESFTQGWCKVQKSVFIVNSETENALEIANYLWDYMDNNDRLFVIEVTSHYAEANSICEESGEEWLRQTFA